MGWFDKGKCRYIEFRDFDVVSFSCVEIFNGMLLHCKCLYGGEMKVRDSD